MPLVAYNDLPTFQRLEDAGLEVLTPERAGRREGRELHIGLLNMMPDAALSPTELQFMRLVGAGNLDAKIYVYPFSIKELNRGAEAEEHIRKYYVSFGHLSSKGLDALIISGANVANPSLDQEPFWKPLIEVVRWAETNVASILCSCLATHALVKYHHGIDRVRLPRKRWGVYQHGISEAAHPIVRDIDMQFDAPHSRYNEITRQQLEDAGLTILAESPEAGVHLAVSRDQFRTVYFQGHPEYQSVSLLKEYKREVFRYINGELDAPPPYPEHYFSEEAIAIAAEFMEKCEAAFDGSGEIPEFPEEELVQCVHNTWTDVGNAMVSNWLGLVHRLSNRDRKRQFAAGIDPDQPLALLAQN